MLALTKAEMLAMLGKFKKIQIAAHAEGNYWILNQDSKKMDMGLQKPSTLHKNSFKHSLKILWLWNTISMKLQMI